LGAGARVAKRVCSLGRARPRPKQAYEPDKGKKAKQKGKGARHEVPSLSGIEPGG